MAMAMAERSIDGFAARLVGPGFGRWHRRHCALVVSRRTRRTRRVGILG